MQEILKNIHRNKVKMKKGLFIIIISTFLYLLLPIYYFIYFFLYFQFFICPLILK